jgi:hypothetical protein
MATQLSGPGGTTIFIKYDTGNINYSIDDINYNILTNYSINNTDTASGVLTIQFVNELTLTGISQYFIITSENITIDGNYKIVNITVNLYPGLVQNGFGAGPGPAGNYLGYNNIIIKNISINSSNTLSLGAGWIGQQWFRYGNISNCNSNGNITGLCGGIVGSYVGYPFGPDKSPNVTIDKCYNTGQLINSNAGGICGYDPGIVTITNSYSTGNIGNNIGNNCGGIFGGRAGNYGPCIAENCYSTGNIYINNTSNSAGGIFGTNSGVQGYGSLNNYIKASNCYYNGSQYTSITNVGQLVASTTYSTQNNYNIFNNIYGYNTAWNDNTATTNLNTNTGVWNETSTNTPWTLAAFAPCFNKGTKILCINKNNEEEYIPIEKITNDILIKTYKHGNKKIYKIANNIIHNDCTHFTKSMYIMKKRGDMIDDLIVTGGHSILIDEYNTEEIKDEHKNIFGKLEQIDNKYLLLAGKSELFEQIKDDKSYIIYHIALINDDEDNDCTRYGIWANGILTESTFKYIVDKYLN